MKNYVTIGGGLLTAISMFLSFVSFLGSSLSGLEVMKLNGTAWVGYFWIACGVVIAMLSDAVATVHGANRQC